VKWYHLALDHCGVSRLADTLRIHFHHPQVQFVCEKEVGKCDPCQRLKRMGHKYVETTSREAPLLSWQDVAVDLIGPWNISLGNQEIKFSALTMIDMVSHLVEVVRVTNETSTHVALHLENAWLARYPKPVNVIHDQGGEFREYEFHQRLRAHHIISRPTTAKIPKQMQFVNECTKLLATPCGHLRLCIHPKELSMLNSWWILPLLMWFLHFVASIIVL
jgi:hypothetical protein